MGTNLRVVPAKADRKLTLVHGDLDRTEYLRGRHREVREHTVAAISARPRKAGPRPLRRLYDTAEGSREPLGPAMRHIEALAHLLDHARSADERRVHITAIYGLCEVLAEYATHAIEASDVRRALNATHHNDGGAA